MTLNETKLPAQNLLDTLIANLRSGLTFMAKFAIAGLLIVFAGILTVAAAIAGLVIASIAILLRFVGRQRPTGGSSTHHDWTDAGTVTLEARRTNHGWRVE